MKDLIGVGFSMKRLFSDYELIYSVTFQAPFEPLDDFLIVTSVTKIPHEGKKSKLVGESSMHILEKKNISQIVGKLFSKSVASFEEDMLLQSFISRSLDVLVDQDWFRDES